jgi:integrase
MARKLTDIGIRNLKPRAARYEVPDRNAGLSICVFPTGAKSYVVRFRHGGKSKKLTLKSGISLSAARKAAADAMHELSQGRDPTQTKKVTKQKAVVAAANILRAVAENYLTSEERKPVEKRLRTIGQRRATFARLIYPKLGDRPIGEIRRSEVAKLLDGVADQRGGRMADEVLGCLRIVFAFHERRDDDFRSPLTKGMGLTKPEDRIRNRVLDEDEIVRVWNAASAMRGPFGHFVRFTLLTATRRSESAQMTRSEVAPNGDWIIPAKRYKSKVDHLIPLSGAARAILAEAPRIAGSDFVFASSDGRTAIGGFSSLKRKLDKLAKVQGWRLHDLRRSARTQMAAAGVNPDHAERALGHALPGIRKNYDCHSFRSEKAVAFEMLATRIERLVNPPKGGNVVALPSRASQ